MRSDSTASANLDHGRTVAELNRQLDEAHQREAASADLLKLISRSALDLQAVLDAVAESAASVCGAKDAQIFRIHGDSLRMVASFGRLPVLDGFEEGIRINRDWVTGRSVVDRGTVQVRDLAAVSETEFPQGSDYARRFGHRTTLATPLVREGSPIGAILIRRNEVRPFSDRQIKLLETFADQVVIAIENARLFYEVQTRTQELKEALEQQTATAEILRVISNSPTDTQPVFDTIMQSAVRLCGARYALVYRLEGEMLQLVGHHNFSPGALEPFRRTLPHQLSESGTLVAQAMLSGKVVVIDDIERDARVSASVRELARSAGYRSVITVPMMREGRPLGAVALTRSDERGGPSPFSREQIRLLETFADHVGIAIENTRLFEEVQTKTRELTESLEYQSATSDVLGVISRSKFDLQPVLDAIVETAGRLCQAENALIFKLDDGEFRLAAAKSADAEHLQLLLRNPPRLDRGSIAGRAAIECTAIHIPDVTLNSEYAMRDAQRLGKYRTMLGIPLLREGVPIGVILLHRSVVKPYTDKEIDLVTTFADQAVIAIENTRLFEQIAQKSRELEIASQHKSRFVANMSHELRTPLAAILGYAELMQEGFYEPQGKKSLDALTRIRSNGKHLLGLISTVLDIAKIESGQFSLNLTEYAMESVVEAVRAATKSLAETKKLALKTDNATRLPVGLGDEQRLTQVLLNLVGNAIKFTDSGGVRITATAMNGHFTVAVTDTGPGMPPEELKRVFEQFHQIDNSNTKAKGGTGLGLAIAKQIVEMHGGRIWVESTLGKGATFQMELPVRAEFRKGAA